MKYLIISFSFIFSSIFAQPTITIATTSPVNPNPVVITLAGSGTAGNTNGTGTAASFNDPYGVAVDGSGNMYVADHRNNLIRKITPAGVVTTLAGSGSTGSTNGTGTAASFNYPGGIAVDGSGNVYVGDTGNNLIRKITPAGVVTTLAGSGSEGSANETGTAASFRSPWGVAVDGSDNVYVADPNNNLIRKITSAGVVTTLAGSGSSGSTNGTGTAASFRSPWGVAVDGSGNVYVADRSNHLIRKITPEGVVTTLAGSGSEGSANGTGTAASFNSPSGVAVDFSGNVYVADQSNNLIRKITPEGVVTTLAGSGSSGSTNGIGTAASFGYPAGVAVDVSSNVYVADISNHLIRKIATTLPSGSTYGGSPLLLNFTTSKPTTDFAVGDISVTGGTLSSFTAIYSTVYTAIFTPSAIVSSLITIDVAAGSFTDATGNNNTAATQYTLNYDLQPSAPTGLVATPGSGQITISWSANSESDFAKYYIYGGTSASPTTKVDSTTNVSSTTKTIPGLTNGTTYYYRISAVDNGGYESDKTSDVSATPSAVRTIRNGMFLSDASLSIEDTVSLSLNIKSIDDIKGFQLNIEYDTSHVLFDTLIANDIINQFTLLANEPEKGKVKIVALSFTGEKIEKGVKNPLFIKFKIRDGASFTHTKINISEPVFSDMSGSSIVPKVFPGYIVNSEHSYLTVFRLQSSWLFNLANVFDYAALQFTINYDTNSVKVDSVKSSDRTSNFNFNYNQPTKGKLNIVINSFDNRLLQKGNGYIAQLFNIGVDTVQSKDDFSFSEAFGVDANGLVSQIITLDSYHINSPPVIAAVSDITIQEDETTTVTLSATDAEGNAITYSAISDTNAVTVSVSSSTLTLTPTANWNGVANIKAYASDGISKGSTTFTLSVTPVNDAPLITTVADDSTNEETEKVIVLDASDVDGDALTYTATSDTSGVAVTISSDTLKLTPALNYSGTSVITVIVSDNALTDTTKFDFKVINVNDAPVIAAVSDVTFAEDTTGSLVLSATDIDGDAVTYSAKSSRPDVVTTVSKDTLTLTPAANWNGVANITAYASDGYSKDSTSFTLTVTAVNDAPTLTNIMETLSTDEEIVLKVAFKGEDVDGDDLTYTYASDTSGVAATHNTAKDSLVLTPVTDFFGNAIITVTVSDGSLSDTSSFTLNVININDAPVLSSIQNQTINEDEVIVVKLTATDLDGDVLTYSGIADTSAVTVTASNDTLELTPKADWNGTSVITAIALDGKATDSTSFTLTVSPVQDLPSSFSWVSVGADSINISQSNLTDTYTLQWGASTDVDGDSIDYLVSAKIGAYPAELIYDTTVTTLPLSYQEIVENVFEGILNERATVRFSVSATDGIDTVKVTGDDRVLFVNRYEYLSTVSEGIPNEFALHENYPNPFNPTTTLRFDLPEVSDATITIFNMLGQKVRTFNMNDTPAGYHSIKWDATNDYGDPVGAGVYLYQFRANQFVKTKKMVLLK